MNNIYEEFEIEINTFSSIVENFDIITSSSSSNEEHDNAYEDFDNLE